MLLATTLAAAVAIAAGAVADAAHVQVTSQVDAHWRGAYDILVRPKHSRLGIEQTAGVVEPNFLGFTGTGGITLDQLAAIRGMADVDVAAPVAFIGMLSTVSASTTIHVSSLPTRATLYQIAFIVTTSDGLGPRPVDASTMRIMLGPGSVPGQPLVATDQQGASWGPSPDGGVDITTSAYLPPFLSPVLAVDPDAEEALLGPAGAFLEPLAKIAATGPYTASTFDPAVMLPGFDARLQIGILTGKGSTQAMQRRPVFPVLVSSRVYAPLAAAMTVVQLGSPFTADFSTSDPIAQIDEAARLAGPGATPVGTARADFTQAMRPLRINSAIIAWPGSSPQPGPVGFKRPTAYLDQLTSRPSYSEMPAQQAGPLRFTIQPLGVVGSGGGPLTPDTSAGTPGTKVGEQAYRSVTSIVNPLTADFVPSTGTDQPFVLAPVGEFDLNSLALPSDPLTYVPLGAYDPPDTTYVADPSGAAVTPKAMTPTLNPAGLIQVPPLAIADLSAAVAFRGAAPIDAIRVRVAGLSGFDEAAKAKVERVASQIAAMGLDVDIVAGSSPQTVNVYVPAYETSVSPPADLGWVEQDWTTLGAATRVVTGLGDTNTALLGLATLALLIVIAGLEVLFAATRRRDAAVLAAVGWSRAARVRWQASEALTAGILVTACGLVAWSTFGRSPAALAVVAGIGAAFPIAGLLAALAVPVSASAVVSSGHGGGLLRRVPVDGLTGFTLRSLVARPGRTLITILALGAAAATTGPALALVASVGLRVGPTRLAGAVGAQLAPYQLALLGLAAAGSVAFALVALRSSVADREEEWRSLLAAGWLPGHLRGLLRRERIMIALPAALLGGMFAWAVAGPVTEATPGSSAAVATGLALSMIAWGGFVARPEVLGRARAGVARSSRPRTTDRTGRER